MIEIAWLARRAVQTVARPAFEQARGKALIDFQRVKIEQVRYQRPLWAQGIVAGTDGGDAAIVENDFQFGDVLGRGAVNWGMRAAGIISNHAAQGRARTGRHIRAEAQAMGPKKIVELIQHYPRPDADSSAFQIQIVNLAVIPGEIDDEAFSDGAADESGPSAARNDRDACLPCRRDNGAGLANIARKGDADRLDLIDGGICSVELTAEIVEGDLAIRAGESCPLLCRCHRLA